MNCKEFNLLQLDIYDGDNLIFSGMYLWKKADC